eukprot:4785334-Amphidinium_carterae.1
MNAHPNMVLEDARHLILDTIRALAKTRTNVKSTEYTPRNQWKTNPPECLSPKNALVFLGVRIKEAVNGRYFVTQKSFIREMLSKCGGGGEYGMRSRNGGSCLWGCQLCAKWGKITEWECGVSGMAINA